MNQFKDAPQMTKEKERKNWTRKNVYLYVFLSFHLISSQDLRYIMSSLNKKYLLLLVSTDYFPSCSTGIILLAVWT